MTIVSRCVTWRRPAKHGRSTNNEDERLNFANFCSELFRISYQGTATKSRQSAVSCLLEDCPDPNTLNLPRWPTAD